METSCKDAENSSVITSYKQIQTSSNPTLSREAQYLHRKDYCRNSGFSCVQSGTTCTGVMWKWGALSCLICFWFATSSTLSCSLLGSVHPWKCMSQWFFFIQNHSHIAASFHRVGFQAHPVTRISAAGPVKVSGIWLVFGRRDQYVFSADVWGFSVQHLRWKSFWVHMLGTLLWLGVCFLWPSG